MSLTPQQVEHIANLARLGLSEAEITLYAQQLSNILEYVGQLQKVDTSSVEPTNQVTGLENVMRDDVVDEVADGVKQALIAAAPAQQDNLVKTKSVF